ncbi:MAG: PrgI family protein [bacterium]
MEQHPIPRQITTFEFKLIGFMTLKQFIYLVVFLPLAYVVMSALPIPVLNIILAALIAFSGIALAFIPINDRPLDIYVKNFVKRMITPTQYYYQKSGFNQAVIKPLLENQQLETGLREETNKKLSQYISQTKKTQNTRAVIDKRRKEEIKVALNLPIPNSLKLKNNTPLPQTQTNQKPQENSQPNSIKKPFLTGAVKNRKQIALPGMLVYINDQNNNPLRLLKTDENGNFNSYRILPNGVYDIEIKDPNNKHMFDKVKINLNEENLKTFEFFSKELI